MILFAGKPVVNIDGATLIFFFPGVMTTTVVKETALVKYKSRCSLKNPAVGFRLSDCIQNKAKTFWQENSRTKIIAFTE
jgi:hypothetical protein